MTRGVVGVDGDVARVFSPVFSVISNSSCLSFYFNLHGKMIGKLEVFLIYNGL